MRVPGRGLRGQSAGSPSLPGTSGTLGAPAVACPICASTCHSSPVLVALALQPLEAKPLSSTALPV
jgi:hypothetical protein